MGTWAGVPTTYIYKKWWAGTRCRDLTGGTIRPLRRTEWSPGDRSYTEFTGGKTTLETILRATSYGRKLSIGQTHDGCITIIIETEDGKNGVRQEIMPEDQADFIIDKTINKLLEELSEVTGLGDPKWFWD